MNCEACGVEGATVELTQMEDGEMRKWHLCEACASQDGFNVQDPISLTEILFGAGGEMSPVSQPEKACPNCQLRRADFKKTSRLGCPECYEVFQRELAPVLDAMHKGDRHVGRVPRREQVSAEIAALQSRLKEVIDDQNFEEAAVIRDQIQQLETEHAKDAAAHAERSDEVG